MIEGDSPDLLEIKRILSFCKFISLLSITYLIHQTIEIALLVTKEVCSGLGSFCVVPESWTEEFHEKRHALPVRVCPSFTRVMGIFMQNAKQIDIWVKKYIRTFS